MLVWRALRNPQNAELAQLASETMASERMRLASQWFHCVKVGSEVLDAEHPLNALFAGEHPPRILLASRDRSKVLRAFDDVKHRLDWMAVTNFLRTDYTKSANRHVRELQKVIVAMRKLNQRHKDVSRDLQRAEDTSCVSRSRKARKKLKRIEADFKKTLAKEKRFQDLGLRRPKKKAS